MALTKFACMLHGILDSDLASLLFPAIRKKMHTPPKFITRVCDFHTHWFSECAQGPWHQSPGPGLCCAEYCTAQLLGQNPRDGPVTVPARAQDSGIPGGDGCLLGSFLGSSALQRSSKGNTERPVPSLRAPLHRSSWTP